MRRALSPKPKLSLLAITNDDKNFTKNKRKKIFRKPTSPIFMNQNNLPRLKRVMENHQTSIHNTRKTIKNTTVHDHLVLKNGSPNLQNLLSDNKTCKIKHNADLCQPDMVGQNQTFKDRRIDEDKRKRYQSLQTKKPDNKKVLECYDKSRLVKLMKMYNHRLYPEKSLSKENHPNKIQTTGEHKQRKLNRATINCVPNNKNPSIDINSTTIISPEANRQRCNTIFKD